MKWFQNQICGVIQDLNEVADSASLDCDRNNLSDQLPYISFNVSALNLSKNHNSGLIEYFLCSRTIQSNQMEFLSL